MDEAICPRCGQESLHVYDGEARESFNLAPGWQSLHEGAIITEAGSSLKYHTGDWRTERPEWLPDRCIHCLLCWMYCPDAAFYVVNKNLAGVNYDLCKGCGVCAQECPVDALAMREEE